MIQRTPVTCAEYNQPVYRCRTCRLEPIACRLILQHTSVIAEEPPQGRLDVGMGENNVLLAANICPHHCNSSIASRIPFLNDIPDSSNQN